MFRKHYILSFAFALIVALYAFAFRSPFANSVTGWQNFGPEQWEVVNAIRSFHELYSQARRTGDVELLDQVLVDHPIFRLTLQRGYYPPLKQFVAEYSGAEVAKGYVGYLTAIKNKLRWRLLTSGNTSVEEVSTDDEYLGDDWFFRVDIRGNRADVWYETAASQHAILYRINGKWYIAQITH